MVNFSNRLLQLAAKLKLNRGQLIISCKRPEFNHYSDSNHYGKFDEILLASKGWTHHKSRNDHFTILPQSVKFDRPTIDFDSLDVANPALDTYGIHAATEFQVEAIRLVQSGAHTLLGAETGCGKTIAYLLPLIQRIKYKEKQLNTPKVVVVCPNRELTHQIGEVATTLGAPFGVIAATLVGGVTKRHMNNPSFSDIDILVATPGVLSKLSTVGMIKLHDVTTLVLDEADTLLDDSFAERLGAIISRTAQAQLILVSATLPKKYPAILEPYLETMKDVISPRVHNVSLTVEQKFMRMTRSVKPSNLLQAVKNVNVPMLVFTNRNETCKWLAMFLRENSVACSNISGDMNQHLRVEQWNQFVRGETQVLSATDIASRGLNTIQVGHVLNYDFPLYASDYLHRIGRVGRIGSPAHCKVTNFVTSPGEIQLVQQIELSVRRQGALENVDANITNIVQRKILRPNK